MQNKLISTFIFMLCTMTGLAQSSWDNYELMTTKQGLPHNIVQAILQDSEGFLWIGTYGGLCVYDGNKLDTKDNVFGKKGSNNWFHAIEAIYEDKDSNIWIGSRGGLVSCYIRKQAIFKLYSFSPQSTAKINCFFQDNNDNIWVGNNAGYLGYVSGDTIYSQKVSNLILTITQTTPGALAILDDIGLQTYDIKSHEASYLEIKDWGKSPVISGQADTHTGKMIILSSTEGGVIDISRRKVVRHLPVLKNNILTVYQKTACTGDGFFLHTNGYTIREYTPGGLLKESMVVSENEWFDKNGITNCITGDSNMIWIGTNSGLYKIDKRKYRFKKYTVNNASAKITDNYIRSVFFDKEHNLWIGFRKDKINRLGFDEKTQQYTLKESYPLQSYGTRVYDSYVNNVFCTTAKGDLIGGGEIGVAILNKSRRLFEPYMKEYIPDTLHEVWSLYEDKNKNIWIGTRIHGLYIFNPASKKLYQYRHKPDQLHSLSSDAIWNIYEDRKGTIWLGTDNGLDTIVNPQDVAHMQFAKYPMKEKEPLHIWNFAEDTAGNLFIGTIGNGVYEIGKNTPPRHIDHLKADVISAMVFDKQNNLWAGTVNGLYKCNFTTDQYTVFDENDGLLSSDFNFKAAAISPEGEMFFGGKSGMVSFYPGKIQVSTYSHVPVRITTLRIAGADSSPAINARETIQLTRLQNYITIGFSVLDFTKPLSHQYRYQLGGFEHAWNYAPAHQPWATYTNLHPGTYKFTVQGSADGLHWSDQEAILDINIRPALWQQPYFQFITVLLFLLIIVLAIYLKTKSVVRKERAQNKIEKQIAGLELKALQAQMNPHFIFNSLNAIQQFVLHNNELEANDYLTRFARLMRLFLESSKNRYVTLEVELEQLRLYVSLERLRFGDKFDYEINIAKGINISNTHIPSMLIQPFVENAINHGLVHKKEKGLLKIEFSWKEGNNNLLRCVIDDDGVGREKASLLEANKNEKHISRGIQLIEERVKTYNFIDDQDIQIHIIDKQLPLQGTIVEIIIPVSRIH